MLRGFFLGYIEEAGAFAPETRRIFTVVGFAIAVSCQMDRPAGMIGAGFKKQTAGARPEIPAQPATSARHWVIPPPHRQKSSRVARAMLPVTAARAAAIGLDRPAHLLRFEPLGLAHPVEPCSRAVSLGSRWASSSNAASLVRASARLASCVRCALEVYDQIAHCPASFDPASVLRRANTGGGRRRA